MTSYMFILSACILCLVSLVHVYWALGGVCGTRSVIPMKEDGSRVFVPSRTSTWLVAAATMLSCLVLLAQVGYLPFYHANGIAKVGCAIVSAVFILRAVGDFRYVGFFKRVTGTAFSKNDTFLYTPLFLYLSIIFLVAVLA